MIFIGALCGMNNDIYLHYLHKKVKKCSEIEKYPTKYTIIIIKVSLLYIDEKKWIECKLDKI